MTNPPQFRKDVFTIGLLSGVFFLCLPSEDYALNLFLSFISFAACASEVIEYRKAFKQCKKVDTKD